MPCGTTQTLIARSTHPQEFSCSVFKPPNSTPPFTLFMCGGNSPRGTYIFTKPPTVFKHTQVNTAASISKKKIELNQTIYIQKYVFRNIINTVTLKKKKKRKGKERKGKKRKKSKVTIQ